MTDGCELINEYTMQEWLDEIISIDEYGEIEWERDEDGNIVQLTDHFGRPLNDPYTGKPIPKPVFIQEGTRITAERMNHIEKHICSLYGWKEVHESALEYIMIVLELEGSISGGQGTFFDAISGLAPKGIALDKYHAELTKGANKGATELTVTSVGELSVGDEINIYDDKKFETVTVASAEGDTIKVSAIENTYDAGAYVVRSTVSVDRKNKKYTTDAFTVYNVASRVM